MKKRTGWSSRTVVRYILFQIPSLVLLTFVLLAVRRFVDLHGWVFWGIILLWVAKDVVLFPFVWRAYDRSREKMLHGTVGEKGIAEERLDPSGYIRIHGELWKAELISGGPPVEKGETVWVQGIRGLVLLVQGESEKD
ncbi:MAG: NfeD family protein [Thermodesulfobacteriota bacterium]|nr:NfeD family protein [Thermodesulfobacteriota bacterium]